MMVQMTLKNKVNEPLDNNPNRGCVNKKQTNKKFENVR